MAVKCDLTSPDAAYPYCAKPAPAYIFSILFGLMTLLHIFQAYQYKKAFCWVIAMAGTWETVGFVTRVLATQDQLKLTYLFPSQILILLAPLWVNAFDYMLLGRVVQFWSRDQKLFGIRARRMAAWYVGLDIVSFLIQAAGGSMLNNTDAKTIKLGLNIYMGGVGLQQVFIVVFCYCVYRFQRKAHSGNLVQRDMDYHRLIYIMYASLALITVRIIFRLVEFSGGMNSKIPKTEWFFYVFDATPMFVAITLFNIWHPGQALVGPESEFPKMTRAEKKAKKAAKKAGKEREKAEKKARKERERMRKRGVKIGDEESGENSFAL